MGTVRRAPSPCRYLARERIELNLKIQKQQLLNESALQTDDVAPAPATLHRAHRSPCSPVLRKEKLNLGNAAYYPRAKMPIKLRKHLSS